MYNLFELHVNDGEDESARVRVEEEANRVIDNYARKKVKDMLYQLRVDAVKLYYENQGEELDDSRLEENLIMGSTCRVGYHGVRKMHGLNYVVIGLQKHTRPAGQGDSNLA
jgi:hypothetical protein